MKERAGNIILFTLLVIASGVFTFWLVNRGDQEQMGAQSTIATAEQVDTQIEATMERFLKDVSEKARQYRESRKVLTEMLRPENLRTPEYIDENYALMETLAPQLRENMNDLMSTFDRTEEEIKAILAGQPEEVQTSVWNRWQEMKDRQVADYVDFFSVEEDIIDLYQEMLGFYKEKSETLSVDPAGENVIFENPEDHVQADLYWGRIKDLSEEQARILAAP